MRAQCCICADLFENSASINIAAVNCGHTFHEECLMRWLETSSTCPSCRKQVKRNQIIKRLYFDISEEDVEVGDPDHLLNEISSLKAQITDHVAAKRDLANSRDALTQALAECTSLKEYQQQQLKQELEDKQLIRRELASVEKDNNAYKRQLAEFYSTQKKLKGLQNIHTMLEGSETDVNEMVACYSDGGEVAVKQLASMVVVVKREYSKALDDKRILRNHIKRIKMENVQSQIKQDKMKQEMKKMQLLLKKSNQDVFSLERENNANRRKIAHLRSAVKHNKTEGSKSFIDAVNEDSPNVAYTPPSSHCGAGDQGGEEDTGQTAQAHLSPDSPDLFEESIMEEDLLEGSKPVSPVHVAPKYLKMVHVSSAAEKFQATKQAKVESEKNGAPSMPFSNFSILQKKLTGVSNCRALALPKSRVFNGLGGSVKMETPSETPLGARIRAEFRKGKVAKRRNPLAPKVLPNQQKLVECLSKCPSFGPASLDEEMSGIRIQPKQTALSKVHRKQPFVNDLFRKAVKPVTLDPCSSSSSSTASSYVTYSSDCIDLT